MMLDGSAYLSPVGFREYEESRTALGTGSDVVITTLDHWLGDSIISGGPALKDRNLEEERKKAQAIREEKKQQLKKLEDERVELVKELGQWEKDDADRADLVDKKLVELGRQKKALDEKVMEAHKKVMDARMKYEDARSRDFNDADRPNARPAGLEYERLEKIESEIIEAENAVSREQGFWEGKRYGSVPKTIEDLKSRIAGIDGLEQKLYRTVRELDTARDLNEQEQIGKGSKDLADDTPKGEVRRDVSPVDRGSIRDVIDTVRDHGQGGGGGSVGSGGGSGGGSPPPPPVHVPPPM